VTSSAARIRRYGGPAILSYGFRPLFFAGGLWAAIAMALWAAMLAGAVSVPTAFGPVDWHVHELLFGYLPAVMTGFLLTAVPNWTGRLPMTGRPLALLVMCWLAGRAGVLVSQQLGIVVTAALDLSFLAVLALLIGREIVAGKNWRNMKVLVLVGLLLCANALFHVEAAGGAAYDGYGARLGVATAVFLITVFGGRMIPSFTRNWLARRQPGALPAPFGRFDMAALLAAGIALAAWVGFPGADATTLACLVAGALHVWRLARWAPQRTLAEPLVWILHAGYAFVPLGFVLIALAASPLDLVGQGAALHAWTAGAIGVMTLAVMTRASLGHTGQTLQATPAVTAIYGFALASALLRVAAALGAPPPGLLYLAAALWICGFALFSAVFGPLLWARRHSAQR
jgi:uncharacterized protein involved in response to NO